MTNRQKLNNTAIYDMLIMLDGNLKKYGYGGCILDLITGHAPCLSRKCEECVQKWLNGEEKQCLKKM